MKYLKRFNESEELLNNMRTLGNQVGRLKSILSQHLKAVTPTELYEDYFLEFKEVENFVVHIYNQSNILIHVRLTNMLDKDNIESETVRYIQKMKGVVARLERKFGAKCHFAMFLNGKLQAEQKSSNRKDDDLKFTGVGTEFFGTDKNGSYGAYSEPFPKDKVSMKIDFYLT